jgi:hypothetical protein
MRNSYTGLTPQQFRQAADISEKIVTLQSQLDRILGKSGRLSLPRPKRKVSASTKAKMAAAARARWARTRAGKN